LKITRLHQKAYKAWLSEKTYIYTYREFKGAYMASHEEVFFWSRAKKVGKNFKKILKKYLTM